MSKVLFVTTIPLGDASGGGVYSGTILEVCRDIFGYSSVEILCLDQIRTRSGVVRVIGAFTHSVLRLVPPQITYHGTGISIPSAVSRQIYDFVIYDHLATLDVMEALRFVKCIYVAHNLEHKVARFQLGFASVILAPWLRRWERAAVSRVDGIVGISSEEVRWLSRWSDKPMVSVFPAFGTRETKSDPQAIPHSCSTGGCKQNGVVFTFGFIGSAYWKPNFQAIKHFLKDVCPLIQRRFRLVLAGKGWDKRLGKLQIPHHVEVKALGFVDNVNLFWGAVDWLVNPAIYDVGLNVKVCEALHNGVPVIGYKLGFRGFGPKTLSQKYLVAVDSATDFASKIDKLEPADSFMVDTFSLEAAISVMTPLIREVKVGSIAS